MSKACRTRCRCWNCWRPVETLASTEVKQSPGEHYVAYPLCHANHVLVCEREGVIAVAADVIFFQWLCFTALWRGATVAQKRIELPSNPAMFEKKQSQMAMEAAISASMSHPNVVQTYKCEIVPIKRTLTQVTRQPDARLAMSCPC